MKCKCLRYHGGHDIGLIDSAGLFSIRLSDAGLSYTQTGDTLRPIARQSTNWFESAGPSGRSIQTNRRRGW